MREYLIRPVEGHDWIPVAADALAQVLTPAGWDVHVVPGLGSHRVSVDGVEVAFSDDQVGWQVSVEGQLSHDRADALVDTVARQLAAHAGVATTWVLLTAGGSGESC